MIGQTLPGDDRQTITSDILHFIEAGADLVLCSGGMSVDPDDRTPGAIKDTGADIVTYGAPVLPGAMLLLAYYHKMAEPFRSSDFLAVSCMPAELFLI